MKFSKEDVRKELTAKMKANGDTMLLSDRTLDDFTENLTKSLNNEEIELGAFVDIILPMVKSANGNMRHEISENVKSNEAKVKALQDELDKLKGNQGGNANDEQIKALREELDTIKSEREAEKGKLAMEQNRSNLINKLIESKVEKSWAEKMVGLISLDNIDVEAKSKELVEMFNLDRAKNGHGAYPGGAGGNSSDAHKDILKNVSAIVKNHHDNFVNAE